MFLLNVTAAALLLPVLLGIFYQAGVIIVGQELLAAHPWMSWALQFIPLVVLLLIYVFATLDPIKQHGLFWSNKMLGLSIGVGCCAGAVLYIMDIFTNHFSALGIPEQVTFSTGLGYLLMLGVLVPFAEELLFRGLIQTEFTKRIRSDWKIHPAIWIAVGLEVLAHASLLTRGFDGFWMRAPHLLYVLLFGAIGGWVYHKTQSLTGPFLIHALGNAIELILYWLAAS